MRQKLTDRIVGKYEQRGPDECWPWTAAKTSAGYGHILADGEPGEKRKTVLAHRIMYELLVGPIPADTVLDHTCHNADKSCPGNKGCPHRTCVNPAHAEPISFGENCVRGRGVSAVNKAKTACNEGHEYTNDSMYLSRRGGRVCRICQRARLARWRQRNPGYVPPSQRKAA